jgi:hypothetical protein
VRLRTESPGASRPQGRDPPGSASSPCELLSVGSGRVTCQPVTNGDAPVMSRHPAGVALVGMPVTDPTSPVRREASGGSETRCALAQDLREPGRRRRDPRSRRQAMAKGSQQGACRARRMVHPGCPVGRAAQVVRTQHLRLLASHERLTLLTATKHLHLSQAAVLAELLSVGDH